MQGVGLIRFVFPLDPSYSSRRGRENGGRKEGTVWGPPENEPVCSPWRLMAVHWQERCRGADGTLEH